MPFEDGVLFWTALEDVGVVKGDPLGHPGLIMGFIRVIGFQKGPPKDQISMGILMFLLGGCRLRMF